MIKTLIIAINVAFLAFIAWVIYLANTGQQSILFNFVASFPFGDKFGHFCLFGLLTLFMNMAFSFRVIFINNIKLYWGTGLVFIFVSVEELSQYFIPSRTLDWLDYFADLLGIGFFTFLSFLIAKRWQTSVSSEQD